MKKILFLTLALTLCASSAFAAQDIPPATRHLWTA